MGKRRKQIARKGLHTAKDEAEKDEASKEGDSSSGTNVPINPVPVAVKSPSIASYKIIKQGKKGVYQIVRENGTDKVYMSLGAMLKEISREDLTELYKIVMKRYGTGGPTDDYERQTVTWKIIMLEFKNNSKDNAHNILRKIIMKIAGSQRWCSLLKDPESALRTSKYGESDAYALKNPAL
ncbi:hypothetical protein Tco_1336895 [Tanacetum coccineum]